MGRSIGWSVDTTSTPQMWISFSSSHGTMSGCAPGCMWMYFSSSAWSPHCA
jgi:hypothetical protein